MSVKEELQIPKWSEKLRGRWNSYFGYQFGLLQCRVISCKNTASTGRGFTIPELSPVDTQLLWTTSPRAMAWAEQQLTPDPPGRRKHASTQNKQLLIVLNILSLSQYTRYDYTYTLFAEKNMFLKKSAFIFYQHKIGYFSHHPFKIWQYLQETENCSFLSTFNKETGMLL